MLEYFKRINGKSGARRGTGDGGREFGTTPGEERSAVVDACSDACDSRRSIPRLPSPVSRPFAVLCLALLLFPAHQTHGRTPPQPLPKSPLVLALDLESANKCREAIPLYRQSVSR